MFSSRSGPPRLNVTEQLFIPPTNSHRLETQDKKLLGLTLFLLFDLEAASFLDISSSCALPASPAETPPMLGMQ